MPDHGAEDDMQRFSMTDQFTEKLICCYPVINLACAVLFVVGCDTLVFLCLWMNNLGLPTVVCRLRGYGASSPEGPNSLCGSV